LGQPEGHVHGAVQRHGGIQLGTGLLSPASLGVQGAEATVTVRPERAHPQFVGQSEGLSVVIFGRLGLQGIAMRGDLAEEAQGIRLVATFLVRTGERQRTLGKGVRLLQVASQQMCLPQRETTVRFEVRALRRSALLHRLREQRHSLGDAPGQGICLPQGCSHQGEYDWALCFLATAYGPFEQGERLRQVAVV
jgi:hypothetical protein